jgi:hypothetical protein
MRRRLHRDLLSSRASGKLAAKKLYIGSFRRLRESLLRSPGPIGDTGTHDVIPEQDEDGKGYTLIWSRPRQNND